MKKTFWNKLTARGTRGKTRCAAAVLALAMTFSMGAPLALAAQPEESTAAVTETVSAQQETAMPTLQTETPELAAQDPEAPPVQATEAEENSTNQHTPENSVVLTPEEIRAALEAGGWSGYAALQNNDSYHALKAVDGLIITGATGTNVNDVAVALIGKKHRL